MTQSAGFYTNMNMAEKQDKVSITYIPSIRTDGTKAYKLETLLERFQQYIKSIKKDKKPMIPGKRTGEKY